MNLPFYIAKRYLFSKKSHNAINIISLISMIGIVVATMAMVCTLSVFNGFTQIAERSYGAFDPELKVTPVLGKVFSLDSLTREQIEELLEVELVAEMLEENALLKFEDRQEPTVMLGVSRNFQHLAMIDSLLLDGEFELRSGDLDFGVLGAGLANLLGAHAGFLSPLEIYIPKRNAKVNPANPTSAFKRANTFVSGVFALNQVEYDNQMFLVSIDLMRELLDYTDEVTSLGVKIRQGESVSSAQRKLKAILGDQFEVKTRFEQKENIYKWVNIEKWVTFFMLAIIAGIAIFNVVGSLSMLIIEKKSDIKILQSIGANENLISKIFLLEGWLITFLGSLVGLSIGLMLCLIQEYFGVIRLAEQGTFILDAYPVEVQALDSLIIFATVNILGFIAVLYPIRNLRTNLRSLNF